MYSLIRNVFYSVLATVLVFFSVSLGNVALAEMDDAQCLYLKLLVDRHDPSSQAQMVSNGAYPGQSGVTSPQISPENRPKFEELQAELDLKRQDYVRVRAQISQEWSEVEAQREKIAQNVYAALRQLLVSECGQERVDALNSARAKYEETRVSADKDSLAEYQEIERLKNRNAELNSKRDEIYEAMREIQNDILRLRKP